MREGKLQKYIRENAFQEYAIVLCNPLNLRYITGFSGSAGTAVISATSEYLIVDGRYTLSAMEQAPEFEIITSNNPYQVIKEMNFKTIALEKNYLTVAQFEQFNKALGRVKIEDISGIMQDIRAVKDQSELENITKAAAIGNLAFEHIKSYIQPNMSEREIALELEVFMRKNGASGVSFETIVASGVRSALPHAEATDSKIREDDHVLLDFGCVYNGYCSDMTRMVQLGNISAKQQEICEVVKLAKARALETVRAGVRACDVDFAAREVIKQAGYGDNFVHTTGHGVGLNVHEEPRISEKNQRILRENMVITIEPGIYIEGVGGVRIEDLVIVKQNGCVNLSHTNP